MTLQSQGIVEDAAPAPKVILPVDDEHRECTTIVYSNSMQEQVIESNRVLHK